MTEPSNLTSEERVDLTCVCFDDEPACWGPACSAFEDDDKGSCTNCGHEKECHEQPQ